MRAVNLLPEQHRPVGPSGERSGSAYFFLAALGLCLVAVVAYVFVANQATSERDHAAALAAEAATAEAKVAELAPFGKFKQLKEARVLAVSQLATGRLDWERLTRELSLLMPRDTWLTGVDGSTGEDAAPAAAGETAGPTVKLTGCAKNQPAVATAMVRLKRVDGATDVKLESSTRTAESTPKSTKGKDKDDEDAAGQDEGGNTATSGCGDGYGFTATIELEPVAPTLPTGVDDKTEPVPASLGGGS